MGGKESIARWVKNKPRLANRDYIHFSRAGTDSVAKMLNRALKYQMIKQAGNE
jgi:lysophospholipase L1-like esterase